jgi:hypothetical protein
MAASLKLERSQQYRSLQRIGFTMLGVSGLRTFRAVARRGLPSSDCVVSSQSRFATDSEKPKQKTSKVKKKAKSVKEDSARSKDLDLAMASLDAPSREEPPISEEEKARSTEIMVGYTAQRDRTRSYLQNANEEARHEDAT